MKKTIKLGFEYFDYDVNNNFFTNLLKEDYNVILSKDPDFIVYNLPPDTEISGVRKSVSKLSFLRKYTPGVRQLIVKTPLIGRIFSDKMAMAKKKMPTLHTNATRIFYSWAICHPDMDSVDYAFTEDYDEELKNLRHMRLPWYKFYCNAGKELIKPKSVDFKKIKKEKTKFCNFVYSNNAPVRNKFFKMLSKYKKIDSPGKCFNNMSAFEKTGWIGKKDWQEEKMDFLKPYKFTIAFETRDFLGYVSEKIYHPMRVNSIPIYWGNKMIHRDFNTKSFINYFDFEKEVKSKFPGFLFKIPLVSKIIEYSLIEPITMKKMIKRIIEIDNNDELYQKILSEPWFYDNKLSKYCDDKRYKGQFKKIFG